MKAKYRAMSTFTGLLSMTEGEVREVETEALIIKDLERVGWIQKVETRKKLKEDKEDDKEEPTWSKRQQSESETRMSSSAQAQLSLSGTSRHFTRTSLTK